MFRRILLVAALSTSVAVFGQGKSGGTGGASAGASAPGATATAPPATSAPGVPTTQGAVGGLSGQGAAGPIAPQSPNQTGLPTVPDTVGGVEDNTGTTQGNPANLNNGTLTNGGFVGGSVAGSPLATPNATFASPQPTAGISVMGRAGISTETPIQTGLQSTVTSSTIVYTNVEPVNPPAVNTNPLTSGRMINDLGPSLFVGSGSSFVGSGSSASPMMAAASLGEVAAKFKAQKPTQNVRIFTNADVDRMNSSMNLRGRNINANFTPSAPQASAPESASAAVPPAQSPANQAVASPAQSAPSSPFEPRLSASARPSPAIRAEGAQSSATQSSASTQGEAGTTAQSGSENATTPQVNQQQSGRNNGQESGKSLPATSTLLPLLGILGLASGGIGLFFRKFRR
ncbi:MAG TPA: hypothetical protein VFI72_04755 [Candidatus Angelobacter sp.]|nr:hypothetical protein [Candidatus Angelobacter sp.]